MRQHHCLLAAAALVLTVAAAPAAGLVALSRAQWPLYFNGGATHGHLEIEIAEKASYSDRAAIRYDGFLANVAVDQGFGRDGGTVQEIIISYAEFALKENYDQVVRLYAPGTDHAQAIAEAQSFRKRIDGLREIRFLYEWIFMDSRYVLAEFEFDVGAPRILGFSFRNTTQGFLMTHERADDVGVVLDAFDYVAEGIRRGWLHEHTSHPDDHSIPLGQGLFGISLKIDGDLYGQRQDWTPPSRQADVNSPGALAETALARTASPEEADVVGLWCARDRAGPAKQSHVPGGRIKHVLTMAFGDDFVHYFVEETDPTRIRSMFVGRQGDGFCLSEGPGDPRVRRLLQSEALKDGIWGLWVAQRAS